MYLETFDSIEPPRVFVLERTDQVIAAIVDGSGSWGSGQEAADRVRNLLAEKWSGVERWSIDALEEDVSMVASSTPKSLRDSEFGWSFSATCLLWADGLMQCAAAGLYRVDVVTKNSMETLFMPRMLVDQLLENKTLSPEAAETFEHRHVCLGPFVGDSEKITMARSQRHLTLDDNVFVTHAARFDHSALRASASAEDLAATSLPGAFPSPVIVARRR